MRGLSDSFIEDLLQGQLALLLEAVKQDDTLCMEIRENYINIYYRGGNLLKVSAASEGKYLYQFDHHYISPARRRGSTVSYLLPSMGPAENWVQLFPQLKSEMDLWFHRHPRAERERQQLILRDNNTGAVGQDTHYYIVDLEYANISNSSKFDMLGVRWHEKSKTEEIRLALIEVKHGDNAMSSGPEGISQGIKKHLLDFESFLARKSDWDPATDIFAEAKKVLGQKIRLGLVDGIFENTFNKYFDFDRSQKVECILILSNHNPKARVLKRELQEFMEMPQYASLARMADVKIAQASFMGYGLFKEQVLSLEEYVEKF